MNTSTLVTFIGVTVIILYVLLQLFSFYGIGQSSYGIYLAFIIFIVLSIIILPNNYPTLKS